MRAAHRIDYHAFCPGWDQQRTIRVCLFLPFSQLGDCSLMGGTDPFLSLVIGKVMVGKLTRLAFSARIRVWYPLYCPYRTVWVRACFLFLSRANEMRPHSGVERRRTSFSFLILSRFFWILSAIHSSPMIRRWVRVNFLFFSLLQMRWDIILGWREDLIFFSVPNGKTASSLDTLSSSIIVIVIFIHSSYHPRVDNGTLRGISRDRAGLSCSDSLMRLEKWILTRALSHPRISEKCSLLHLTNTTYRNIEILLAKILHGILRDRGGPVSLRSFKL